MGFEINSIISVFVFKLMFVLDVCQFTTECVRCCTNWPVGHLLTQNWVSSCKENILYIIIFINHMVIYEWYNKYI